MLPLNPAQITGLYNEALRLQTAGKLAEAEAKYRAILGVRPTLPEVHFQLGRIALAAGDPARAATHFDRAAAAKPREAAIWQHYAQAIGAQNDAALTSGFLKKAKAARIDPRLLVRLQEQLSPAKTRSRTGIGTARPEDIQALIGLMNKGAFAQAETAAAKLRARHPDVAIIADILANAQVALNKPAAAEANFEAAIRLDPGYAEAHNNFGRFLIETGRIDEGIAQVRAALKLVPKMPLALQNLGIAHARRGEAKLAIKALQAALAVKPDLIAAQVQLGHQLSKTRDHAGAVRAFQAAIRHGDTRATTLVHLAQAQAADGQDAVAVAAFDKAIAVEPGLAMAYGAKAKMLQTMGRFDEADTLFRKAIELDPDNGEHYRLFIASYKVRPDDPLIAQMQARFDAPGLSDDSRMNLGFALAKALEDTKQHDRVFSYLNPANALMRKKYPYDISDRRVEIDALKAAFSDTDFSARTVAGTSDFAPIFVTGMPRSGTTLVEQILASHSQVTGAGEVGVAVERAFHLLTDVAGAGFQPVSALPDPQIAALGTQIEAHFAARFPGADRVTDKSIQTYLMTGLIHLALPKAKVIVVRRDPRDTLLSIYKNVFAEGTHRYGYNLRDLGLYYRMFEEMVAFWREKLPGGFHEVQYEDLIANPEDEARKLIAAAGLEWQDQCLNFHQNTRRVSTLSVYQVRQPIYKSSMQAWQRYEDDLGELFEALGDAI
ncbi:sulfotransferase [Actibacterium sp. D379-3]